MITWAVFFPRLDPLQEHEAPAEEAEGSQGTKRESSLSADDPVEAAAQKSEIEASKVSCLGLVQALLSHRLTNAMRFGTNVLLLKRAHTAVRCLLTAVHKLDSAWPLQWLHRPCQLVC